MTTPDVHSVPPEPEDLAAEPMAPSVPNGSDRAIVLNGVEVSPDGQPLQKTPWWRRG